MSVPDLTPLLYSLPWLGLFVFARFVARFPAELPPPSEATREGESTVSGRSVSVIVPARNETLNIEACVASLLAQEYRPLEIIVVDDRSEDNTANLARGVEGGAVSQESPPGEVEPMVTVLDGRPLPEGWLGKPWACWQGAEVATGDLLLFTDADTTHSPRLLGRAVAGLEEEGADLLTIVGRQIMASFWERLVQPQIFFAMLLRFPDFERAAKNAKWRDAIANGQYLLFTREVYDRLEGHQAVKGEVVEDLAMAQHVKRTGLQLRIRSAETDFATRMYRSLDDLIEGWSKNLMIGGQLSLPRGLRSIAAPLAFAGGMVFWLLPSTVLALWAAGGGFTFGGVDLNVGGQQVMSDAAQIAVEAGVLVWAVSAYLISVAMWSWFTRRMGAQARYGWLYPLGAGVSAWIFLRSWRRGRTVEWKGRVYEVTDPADAA